MERPEARAPTLAVVCASCSGVAHVPRAVLERQRAWACPSCGAGRSWSLEAPALPGRDGDWADGGAGRVFSESFPRPLRNRRR